MTDWSQVRLPPGAAMIDRLTFPVWKWWHRSLRETLRLAYWTALALAAAIVLGLFVAQATSFGGSGIAAAVVIIAGIAGGWLTRTGKQSQRQRPPIGSRVVAVLLALPLAILMMIIATIGAGAVVSFVVVPVANYGLPMLIVVGAAAAGVGRAIFLWRKREATRYPPPIV